MPGIQDAYNEAVQLPSVRLKVTDPDLKQGKVEMIKMPSSVGNYKLPWANRGSFAIVYKFRTHSGQFKALRCFLGDVDLDTHSRYEKMSCFFAAHAPTITAGFQYYDAGINIKLSNQLVTRPIIVMDWIEGGTLLNKVNELCKQRDTASLGLLVEQWLELMSMLRTVHMAHGDFTSENVMIGNDGRLVLVDYDGVYIPDFQGMPSSIVGQEAYQHPHMNDRPFDEQMDSFSAYVIYIALLALHSQPQLWQKYNKLPENNLLFTRDDFMHPDTSPLLRELEQMGVPDLKQGVQNLKRACKMSINQVNLPLPECNKKEKALLARLEDAIGTNDDESIVQCWTPLLAAYAPAEQYQNRVLAAQQRLQALKRFRDALQRGNIEQIVSNYAPTLEVSRAITQEEYACLSLARDFYTACRNDDDDAIVVAHTAIINAPQQGQFVFTEQEKQRLQRAQKYKSAVTHLRLAWYRTRNAKEVIDAYDPLFDTYKPLPDEDQELLQAAKHFIVMHKQISEAINANNGAGDDRKIVVAYNQEIAKQFVGFTPQQKERIKLAQNRELLQYALCHNFYREVIRCAQEIEVQTGDALNDDVRKAVSEVKKRYIRHFQPKDVQVNAQNKSLTVTWKWPADTLIQYAVIAWRNDRWPLRPGEQGTFLSHPVPRQSYEVQKGFHFTIAQHALIYLQVYFALQDGETFTHGPTWIYSIGDESSSKCMVHTS
jgi:hypothetical protein